MLQDLTFSRRLLIRERTASGEGRRLQKSEVQFRVQDGAFHCCENLQKLPDPHKPISSSWKWEELCYLLYGLVEWTWTYSSVSRPHCYSSDVSLNAVSSAVSSSQKPHSCLICGTRKQQRLPGLQIVLLFFHCHLKFIKPCHAWSLILSFFTS